MADRIRFVLRGRKPPDSRRVTGHGTIPWLAAFSPLSSTGRPGHGAMAVALSRRVLSRPLARAALRPLGTAAADVEQSFSLALSEEQQAFKDAVRLPPLPTHAITATPDTRAITAARRTPPPPLAGTQVCAGGGDARRRGVRPHHGVPAARLRQGVGAGPGQHTHPRGVRRARPRLPRGLPHRGGARVRLHGNRARQSPSIHTAALRNAIACLASSVQPAGHLFSPQRPPLRSAAAPSPRRPCPRHRAS